MTGWRKTDRTKSVRCLFLLNEIICGRASRHGFYGYRSSIRGTKSEYIIDPPPPPPTHATNPSLLIMHLDRKVEIIGRSIACAYSIYAFLFSREREPGLLTLFCTVDGVSARSIERTLGGGAPRGALCTPFARWGGRAISCLYTAPSFLSRETREIGLDQLEEIGLTPPPFFLSFLLSSVL